MHRERVPAAAVWRTGALGDFVLTLPVLDALRERADRLIVIAPSRYQALFGRADRWIDADGPEATALFAGRLTLEVDLGLAWSSLAGDALARAGARRVRTGAAHPSPGTHQCDQLWRPLEDWLGPRRADPRITEPGVAQPPVDLVIAPGSGGTSKRIPLEHLHALARGRDALWVGGPQERDEPGWGSPRRDDLGLPELIGLARACREWIGPDAGPQHLAAAAGARVTVLFNGATDPAQWAPRSPRVTVRTVRPPAGSRPEGPGRPPRE